MLHTRFTSIATWLHLIDTSSLPGIKAFEVDSCSSNNLLPQLQVFPQRLDHWKRQITPNKTFFFFFWQFIRSNIWQWSCIDIRHERACVWYCATKSYQNKKKKKKKTQHTPFAKKICSFQYSSSDRNFRSFWRSFIRSCLSRTHCKLGWLK